MKKFITFSVIFIYFLGATFSPSSSARAIDAYPEQGVEQNQPDIGTTQQFDQLVDQWTAPDRSSSTASDLPKNDPDKVVYLTFDDGPDPDWTPKILKLLSQYGATAVFYMIGRNARTFPETTLQVAQAGQMIGLHGYNHIALSEVGYKDFYLEVSDSAKAVQDALAGHSDLENNITPCLRPPYGAVNDAVYSYAYQMNYAISMWELDTLDWQGPSADEILNTVAKELENYSVVLMHDGGEDRAQTVLGLGLILHELSLRGYTFLPYCNATGQELNR